MPGWMNAWPRYALLDRQMITTPYPFPGVCSLLCVVLYRVALWMSRSLASRILTWNRCDKSVYANGIRDVMSCCLFFLPSTGCRNSGFPYTIPSIATEQRPTEASCRYAPLTIRHCSAVRHCVIRLSSRVMSSYHIVRVCILRVGQNHCHDPDLCAQRDRVRAHYPRRRYACTFVCMLCAVVDGCDCAHAAWLVFNTVHVHLVTPLY